MTDNTLLLQQKHAELERRHDEAKEHMSRQFSAIMATLGGIDQAVRSLDKQVSLSLQSLETAKSDIESGKYHTSRLKEETDEIGSGVLKLRSDLDHLAESVKNGPTTFWTSITAAATAIGSVVYIIFHGGKP